MTDACFYKDEKLKEMDIRLANMSYYHDNGDKLVNDINEECFIKIQVKDKDLRSGAKTIRGTETLPKIDNC